MTASRVSPLALLGFTLVAVGACSGEDGLPPGDLAVVAGSYTAEGPFGAISFTTFEDGSTEATDWLARGASIVLDLRADGTTGGRLFVPGADEDGSDLDSDLEGTWTLAGGRVALQHEADTFLRDMEFVLDGSGLVGEETFSGTTIRVELVRR